MRFIFFSFTVCVQIDTFPKTKEKEKTHKKSQHLTGDAHRKGEF